MIQKLQVHPEGTFETPDRLYSIIKEISGRHKGNLMGEHADNSTPRGKLVAPQIGGRNRSMVGQGSRRPVWGTGNRGTMKAVPALLTNSRFVTELRKLWRHPLLSIALGTAIILLVIIGTKSMHTTANSFQNGAPKGGPLVVITNSGSTNTPESTLTINTDGSGSLMYHKDTYDMSPVGNSTRFVDKTFPAGTFNIAQLKNLLTQIGDVSAIPDHGCIKSISFGSTTTITYLGKTSGDISCLSNADLKIYLDAKEQVEALYTQALKH